MNAVIYDVVIELTEDCLGTVPHNREVYSQHVARKALAAAENIGVLAGGTEATRGALKTALMEEEGAIEELEAKGWTGFPVDEKGDKFLWDYMIKGHLNAAADVIGEWRQSRKDKDFEEKLDRDKRSDGDVLSLKYKFRRYVFVKPRKIYPPQEFFSGSLERPLRCETPQGPRVSVVRSDLLKAGARMGYEIHVIQGKLGKAISEDIIREALSYGAYLGLGQWRTGSYGQFSVVSFKKRA